ncbi:MAG: NADH-quinone oxidoreductase subunit J [Spirochaetota bacterium]
MLGVIFFWVFAVLVVAAAIAMVFSKNLVHSALFMAGTFFLIACLYILMGADYVGAVQILVYVGAISILFVFGIMLTKRDRIEDSNRFNRYGLSGGVIAVALFAGISTSVLSSVWHSAATPAGDGSTVQVIAGLFLNEYVLAFELAAILLRAALLGAIVIGQAHFSRGKTAAPDGPEARNPEGARP